MKKIFTVKKLAGLRPVLFLLLVLAAVSSYAQAPHISYSSPQVYTVSTAIAPLTPVNTGGAVPDGQTPVTYATGFNAPDALAIDAAGNIYVCDRDDNDIKKIPAGGGTPVIIGSGFNAPTGVAVDAAGNVYVVDNGNNTLKKIPVGGGDIVDVGAGLTDPFGVAVDPSGNIYVTEGVGVAKIPAAGGAVTTWNISGAIYLAADAAGNVYVYDRNVGEVFKITATTGNSTYLASVASVTGLSTDGAGNVYCSTYSSSNRNSSIIKINAANASTSFITGSVNQPNGIAVSAVGDIYTSAFLPNTLQSNIVKIAFGKYTISAPLPPGLSFNTTTGVISGTPVVVGPAATYTVTAFNSSGRSSASINIAVSAPAAPNISYSSPQVYTAGAAISPLTPVNSGGSIVSAPTPIVPGFTGTGIIAADAGNVYVAAAGTVKKVPLDGSAPTNINFNAAINSIALDAAGNVYAAISNGVKEWFASSGTFSVFSSGAHSPISIASDASGNVFVGHSNGIVYKIPVSGRAAAVFGDFTAPNGIAVDGAGNVYVADRGRAILCRIPPSGSPVSTLFSGLSAIGVAADNAGNLYYILNNAVTEIPAGGGNTIPILSGANGIQSLAVDGSGNIYISNTVIGTVEKIAFADYTINKALPAGLVFSNTTGIISGTPIAASPATNYTVTAVNAGGNSSAIVNITVNLPAKPNISYTSPQVYNVGIAATPLSPVNTGGVVPVRTAAQFATGFSNIAGVAVDAAGNVYVSDQNTNTVTKISATDGSRVIIGSGFNRPVGIAVDASGNVYVADESNHAVKKIPAGGGAVVSIGFSFNSPYGIALDAAGNIYVSDIGNYTVKKMPAGGGTPVSIGTGFSAPEGIAVMGTSVYVASPGNNQIRKISTLDGSTSTFASVLATSLAVDSAGNVYYSAGSTVVTEIPVKGGPGASIGVVIDGIALAVDQTGNLYVPGSAGVLDFVNAGGYTISPTLPPGLSLDPNTGIIGGKPTTASAAANYTITGYNLAGSGSATVNIQVTNSANLSSLIMSTGTLSPAFNTAITSYTDTVAYGVNGTAIAPTAGDNLATIKVNGAAVSNGARTGNIPLNVGANTINTVVTGRDGVTTKTYTVTVFRLANATLSSLRVSGGTLSPVFAAATANYTLKANAGTSSTTVTPTATDPASTIKVNGTPVASGSASGSIPLNIGPNTVTVVVSGADGITTKTYSVIVTRIGSPNAGLAYLRLSGVTLSPAFTPGVASYTASVSNDISSTTVTPTTSVTVSTVKVNGVTVASGVASGVIPLNVGTNVINTVVTAQDGITTQTYSATVTRAASAGNLAGLRISTGPLSPAFSPARLSYTAIVHNFAESVIVTPTTHSPTDTVRVNGVIVTSGMGSAAIALSPAVNTIPVVVTTPNGGKKTYIIAINVGSPNASLAYLRVTGIPISPLFVPATANYTAAVANDVTSTTVIPTTSVTVSTVKVNGVTVASGSASNNIPLNVGPNTISVVVTAQDGSTTRTYTVTVTRAATTVATLSSLVLSTGKLSPAFDPATTGYTAAVGGNVSSIALIPVATNPDATITVNGATVMSGSPSASIPLAFGNNTITTVVTAQDGVTTDTYTITINRPASANANIVLIRLSSGTLSPSFSQATTSYTASVANSVSSITLTPTANDPDATITVNGTAVASGATTAPMALSVGDNVITTIGTATNGTTTKTYTITVTRAMAGANSLYEPVSVLQPAAHPQISDNINVHQGISPNGDGVNDVLVIDGITAYPDNKLSIMSRNGELVFEAIGYNNSSTAFDGHSNKNGKLQSPGTYFYSLDYKVGDVVKHKTGFIVLKW